MCDAESIERTLRVIVDLLVKKDYVALEQLSRGVRLRATEIAIGVHEYGRTLVTPPTEAFSQADVVPIPGSVPPACSVRFRLYTEEEGVSDLELQATFCGHPGDDVRVELDNIVVA